jgi:hypothetical protein
MCELRNIDGPNEISVYTDVFHIYLDTKRMSSVDMIHRGSGNIIKSLNAKLNSICHLLALLGAHHILHVSRIMVNNACLNLNV